MPPVCILFFLCLQFNVTKYVHQKTKSSITAVGINVNINLIKYVARYSAFCHIQIFPTIAADRQNHRQLCNDFISNSRPGTNNEIVGDPHRGIQKNTHNTNFPRIERISAQCCRNIGSDRKNRPPSLPGKKQSNHLQHANDKAHYLPFQKSLLASQTKGANSIEYITDPTGDRTQQQQVYCVAQI